MKPVPKERYEPDFALLDRYQAFSSEITKISLSAIAGITAYLALTTNTGSNAFGDGNALCHLLSLILFGGATAAAILHRYTSTDAMACMIDAMRNEQNATKFNSEKRKMGKQLKYSSLLLLIASLLASIAAICFVIGIVLKVKSGN